MNHHFITASDVLMPRGNGAFGDAGQHGQAQALPWPSVFAGALRSSLLAADPQALRAFPRHPPGALGEVLGTPSEPGRFRLRWLSLALRDADGRIEPVLPLPADRVAFKGAAGQTLHALRPTPWPAGVQGSGALPMAALLQGAPAGKPVPGFLCGLQALRAWLDDEAAGALPQAPELLRTELRLGIALDHDRRTATQGALYTTEALRFARRGEPLQPGGAACAQDAGYLVGVDDGAAALLPASGLLRLGGDGRAAPHQAVAFEPPTPPLARIAREGRFRLALLTPALWSTGSLPPRLRRIGAEHWLQLEGFSARLACTALARPEVISGWDMANRTPKPAQRAAGAGSVFWFDRAEGDPGKLAEWVAAGLWPETGADAARRAEGFNNALLGAWSPRQP